MVATSIRMPSELATAKMKIDLEALARLSSAYKKYARIEKYHWKHERDRNGCFC